MAGFGGSVKLKGESEYRQAIKNITNDLKGMSKSLKDQTTEFSKNDKGIDKSQQSQEELTKTIGEQKKELEKAKTAYAQYGVEVQKQTTLHNTLRKEYNKAVLDLQKVKEACGEASDEYKAQEKIVDDLADELADSSKSLDENKQAMSKLKKVINDSERTMESASDAMDDLGKEIKQSGDEAEDAEGGFSAMTVALGELAAEGISSCIEALKDFVADTGTAYSKFQAQTGASAEEMAEFKDEMNDLYKNNYGESLEDVGDKMAYIKQVTGETDPSKIKELAENAITLEDTFGSDFNETIRGVSNLMTHFGIDSDEAFDLFAKGSQMGLDYTDELGDNIAEYGGNFQQAGYSAEEYFQLLVNGSQGGAYNLDKVNDSINEVKNRLGDGTIGENIDSFSEGTKQAFRNWEDGKGTMKDVIDSIVDDINNCTNEQESLTMAQVAFGTMGEDANLKVVKSLKSTGDAFEDVEGSMEDLKQVRYDNVASQFEALGRTIRMDLITPMAEKALPVIQKFVTYATDNMGTVVKGISAVGVALGAVFVTNKVSNFATSVTNLIGVFGKATTAIKGVEGASLALNTAWLTSPITWLVVALGGLTAALIVLKEKQDEAIEKEYGLSEAQQETIDKSKELADAYSEVDKARDKSVASINSEYGYMDELKREYNSLIDSNGKVKEGYEDRANFILTTLAESLGVERSEIEKNIDANGQLGDSIDKIIEKKRAEAVLNANEQAYTEAIQNRTEALNAYQDAVKTVDETEAKYKETKEKANKVMEVYDEMLQSSPEGASAYYLANRDIIKANEEAEESYKKAKKGLKNAEEAYVGYNSTIQNYEGLSSAIISGDSDKIAEALQNMQNEFITAETGTKKSLEKQVKNLEENYENMKSAIENNTPGVTQEMVDQAKDMVDKATAELDKYQETAEESTKKAGKKAADGFASNEENAEEAGDKVGKATVKGVKKSDDDAEKAGKDAGKKYAENVESNKGNAENAGDTIGKATVEGAKSGSSSMSGTGKTAGLDFTSGLGSKKGTAKNTGLTLGNVSVEGAKSGAKGMSSTGKGVGTDFTSGVNSKKADAKTSGKNLGTNAKSGAESVSARKSGEDFGDGFGKGIESKESSIWTKAWNLGKKALAALRKSTDEHSPSKEARKSGVFFTEGFAIGIEEETSEAIKATTNMAKDTLGALSGFTKEITQLGQEGGQGFTNALNRSLSTDGLQTQLRGVNVNTLSSIGSRANDANMGTSQPLSYNEMVSAFKDALGQMKVELDDDEVGSFVDKTVTRLIYT